MSNTTGQQHDTYVRDLQTFTLFRCVNKTERDSTDPHVSAVGIRIQVMRVDVERDQADGGEAGRVDDWHVVGGVDADSGDVRARAGAHVRNAVLTNAQHDTECLHKPVKTLLIHYSCQHLKQTTGGTVTAAMNPSR